MALVIVTVTMTTIVIIPTILVATVTSVLPIIAIRITFGTCASAFVFGGSRRSSASQARAEDVLQGLGGCETTSPVASYQTPCKTLELKSI